MWIHRHLTHLHSPLRMGAARHYQPWVCIRLTWMRSSIFKSIPRIPPSRPSRAIPAGRRWLEVTHLIYRCRTSLKPGPLPFLSPARALCCSLVFARYRLPGFQPVLMEAGDVHRGLMTAVRRALLVEPVSHASKLS